MSHPVVVISGYMNPIHAGHCEYAAHARRLAGPHGTVICIVNSDAQAKMKKGFSFVPESDRLAVMGALRDVDYAVLSVDEDRTVRRTLAILCGADPALSPADLVVSTIHPGPPPRPTHFVNGGDVVGGCAEEDTCNSLGVELVYGLGDKIQSSSWILKDSVSAAYHAMFH